MRLSFATAIMLSIALSSLAAPLFIDEEGLELRWEDQDLELRGWEDQGLDLRWDDGLDLHLFDVRGSRKPSKNWSTIPHDKKTKQTGRLKPKPGETATHITYKQGGDRKKNPPVHVDQYQVWHPSQYKEGKTHAGIPPPIWHPPAGENKDKKAYAATSSQNPPSYDQVKFSKSIKDKVNNMPSSGNPQGKSRDDHSPRQGAGREKNGKRKKTF